MREKIYFVIPAWNEAKSLPTVLKNLKSKGYINLIVVDDGSTDNTFSVAENNGAIALRLPVNRGQGAAIQTGIKCALLEGAEFIVTFDSDNQHRVEDLPKMLGPVLSGEVDITLGSRFLTKEASKNVPWHRRILLKGSILVQYVFYGLLLTDVHNGYRVMSRDAAKKIRITLDRMAHSSEIVEEIKRNHLRYREISVIINYKNVRAGHGSYFGAIRIFAEMTLKKILR